MLRRLRDLEGWTIEGTDGSDVGTVEDAYFDDDHWAVRYLVARTGSWLSGRMTPISPMAIKTVDWDGSRLRTKLTREQVGGAPATTSAPLARRDEAAYSRYYGYPYYWTGGQLWGVAPAPFAVQSAVPGSEPVAPDVASDESRLRAASQVSGYHIQALDGEIGHVEDFLFDEETWTIRYLTIDTSNWIGGRTVVVAPQWVRRVDWADQKIHVDLTRESVKASPEYDPGIGMEREYEDRLYRYYNRPAYWR